MTPTARFRIAKVGARTMGGKTPSNARRLRGAPQRQSARGRGPRLPMRAATNRMIRSASRGAKLIRRSARVRRRDDRTTGSRRGLRALPRPPDHRARSRYRAHGGAQHLRLPIRDGLAGSSECLLDHEASGRAALARKARHETLPRRARSPQRCPYELPPRCRCRASCSMNCWKRALPCARAASWCASGRGGVMES